jgi:long-chain acyl-CoA synthetase
MMLAGRHHEGSKNVMTLQALKELGKREEAKEPSRFDTNLSAAKPDDLITICYTSGTTGMPKGVMLTHDNVMSVLEDAVTTVGRYMTPKHEIILSFLPFSHIFGKVESLAIYTFGWRQVFAENLDKLMVNIAEVKPTLIFSVPRIFEKAYARIHSTVDTVPAVKKKLFYWACEVGRNYYSAIWEKRRPELKDWAQYQVAKRLVFRKIMQRFGGQLEFAVCGGAPLPKEIGEFFQIVGIQILEGYGLTETCAPVAVNTPDDLRFGVVGRPLPEVIMKAAEDGEILIKSRKVFKAYYKMPEETAQVMQDGWFHTGDIGHIDSAGYLHITDRKKDLIVTSGGKNIAPQKIENIAKTQKLVSEFVVHGDRRNYLTALVTLDRDQIVQYANEHQILFSEYSELIKNPKILSLVQKIIDDVNRQLASFETVKKFVVLPNDFSVENGEITPSLKVKRSLINKRYKTELDSMYGDSARVPLDSREEIR